MDNLVERVRALLGDTNEEQDTINEAADEIERLREALEFIVAYSDCHEAARAAARQALGEGKPLEDRWDNE